MLVGWRLMMLFYRQTLLDYFFYFFTAKFFLLSFWWSVSSHCYLPAGYLPGQYAIYVDGIYSFFFFFSRATYVYIYRYMQVKWFWTYLVGWHMPWPSCAMALLQVYGRWRWCRCIQLGLTGANAIAGTNTTTTTAGPSAIWTDATATGTTYNRYILIYIRRTYGAIQCGCTRRQGGAWWRWGRWWKATGIVWIIYSQTITRTKTLFVVAQWDMK